jgi:hypothetical protein
MTRSSIRCSSGMGDPPTRKWRSTLPNSSILLTKPNHMTNSYSTGPGSVFRKFLFVSLALTMSVLYSVSSWGQTTIINSATAGAFEGTFASDGWTVLNNGTAGASWVASTGATAGFTGSQCAYITLNTAGAPPPHTYTNGPTSRVSALYRDVTVPSGETQIAPDL